jgi:hypothetical protein
MVPPEGFLESSRTKGNGGLSPSMEEGKTAVKKKAPFHEGRGPTRNET